MGQQLEGLKQPMGIELMSHVQSVRLFMRDFAELNLLIRGEESSDRMIVWATFDFLSDFNGSPPFTNYSLGDLLQHNLHSFMVRGTVVSLLESLILIYTRNHLPFSDGGLSVEINGKAPQLQGFLGMIKSAYEQKKSQVKTAQNIQGMISDYGSGGLMSDYSIIHGYGYY